MAGTCELSAGFLSTSCEENKKGRREEEGEKETDRESCVAQPHGDRRSVGGGRQQTVTDGKGRQNHHTKPCQRQEENDMKGLHDKPPNTWNPKVLAWCIVGRRANPSMAQCISPNDPLQAPTESTKVLVVYPWAARGPECGAMYLTGWSTPQASTQNPKVLAWCIVGRRADPKHGAVYLTD